VGHILASELKSGLALWLDAATTANESACTFISVHPGRFWLSLYILKCLDYMINQQNIGM
jgi:hypothetical protein